MPILDGMPAALLIQTDAIDYKQRIPLGFRENGSVYIYNHANLHVKLALAPNKEHTYHVVGFAIKPDSIDHMKLKNKAKEDA